MAQILGLSEIMVAAMRLEPDYRRVDYLKSQRDNLALRFLLKAAFDEDLQWDLPAGNPPYKKSIYPDSQGLLYGRIDEFKSFIRGLPSKWAPEQKDMAFTRMLETIDARDAELLLAVKNRDVEYRYPGITKAVVQEAFGDI